MKSIRVLINIIGKDKEMGNGITIIVGAGAVLDFDHKGIFPSVTNITEEVLKLIVLCQDWQRIDFLLKSDKMSSRLS